MLSERRKLYETRPPEGAKPAKMASFVPVGPNLAAKAARKPSLGGSGALGALLALLDPSWGLLGRSWGVLGPLGASKGSFLAFQGADLDDLGAVCGAM